MDTVYLDNNASTRIAPEVLEAMMPFFNGQYGNPSSAHSFGSASRRSIEKAREQVAALINADPGEIVFTSGGSESDNMAVRGVAERYPASPHIVTTKVEHSAILSVCRHLKRKGFGLNEIGVDGQGRLDMAQLVDAVRPETGIVSVMWANNETGTIFPIEEIVRIVKSKGAVFHSDAVQALGKIPIDVKRVPVDLLSFSGHKIHGPKGIGALYVRKGLRLDPLILGGRQENGRRAGTENVPAVVGMGRACELALARLHEDAARVGALRDRLERGILATCGEVLINGDRSSRLPNTLNVSFEFIEGEAVLLMLDQLGIAASSGSACTSDSSDPSHVLRAMNVPLTALRGSIRFSLGRYNTDAELDFVLEHLPRMVNRLREISAWSLKSA